jgi:lipid II:glycine glycyltransferase (peptidoglycan interpeptide bridge formation enzyme)
MNHILQSKIWKEVKEQVGNKTYEFEGGWFQTTKTPFGKTVGYIPRIDITNLNLDSIYKAGKDAGCTYISIEPNNFFTDESNWNKYQNASFKLSKGSPTQLQFNTILNLEISEEELLNRMDRKDRYNIRVAQKHGVKVDISSDDNDFEAFLKLYLDLKDRKSFYGRGEEYLRKTWKVFKEFENKDNKEYAKIVITSFNGEALNASFVFLFEDTVYYTYSGSANKLQNLKASYAHLWELILWSKNNGYKYFDFYGIEEDYSKGFSEFKTKFKGEIIKYEDTYDLVIDPVWYKVLKLGLVLREKVPFLKNLI